MNKLVFLVSLVLVALVVLDNKHGVHSKSIRMSQRDTVNPSEEKVVRQSALYYDFYLAQQWPGTVCKFSTRNCTTKPNKFTIHGLWPQNTTAWPSTNCCGMQSPKLEKCYYNASAINATQLAVTWPDLFGNNSRFWEHEWTKHGACSVDELPQPDYFRNATKLYNTRNFLQILENEGFKANDSTYNLTDIKRAIWRVTGLNVIVKCRLNASISYLQELYVCVNRKTTAYQCCDPSTTDKCRSQLVFPKI